MKKFIATITVAFIYLSASAQDFSNKGKDFWISYAGHIDATLSAMGIYITSDVAASGNIKVGSVDVPFTVAANSVKRVFIGPNAGGDAPNNSVYLSTMDGITANAAIHVTSNQPVAVYAHIIRSARSGATLVLPVPVWGKAYIVPSYRNVGGSQSFGEINVMASDTNTLVEITPSVNSRNGARVAGTPFTITLNPGDVYQLQFAGSADISGTKVRSIASGVSGCKPIAVFSGTTWSGFDCTNSSGGDNLYQQIFPQSAWGKNFLTAPYKTRNTDIVRVFVSDATAVVQKTENGVTTTLPTLINGAYYEFKTNNPTKITSDKPISVVHYITSQSCGAVPNTNSDPEMIILNPLEQTINNITVFSAHQTYVPAGQSAITSCFLNVIIKTSAAPSFKINGQAPNATFVAIPGTGYSYIQEDVTSMIITNNNPVQTLKADSAFSAIAYGFGAFESYGYNAGTNVKDLYQNILIRNDYATVDFPATCIKTPFTFSITLPYLPTKLVWDFHGSFPGVTVIAPTPDSSYIIDGKTVNVFKIPTKYSYDTVGTYPVTVIATNASSDGCTGENIIDYDLQVFDKPRADWEFTHTGCLFDNVQFLDSTKAFGRKVQKWKWEFGDNTIDSVKNPLKKYAVAGSYPVKLFIITDVGCVSDTTKIFNVTSPPVPKFGTSLPNCPGLPVTFTDSSAVQVGTLVKWHWDYGNGTKETLTTNAIRTITYPNAGTYYVKLSVETNTGCRSADFIDTLVIHPTPVVDFTTPLICLPTAGKFTNATTISDGTAALLTYKWNFDDATAIDTATNPLHTYTGVGPYNINLVATSVNGCTATITKPYTTIYAKPIADFTIPAEVCLRNATTITNNSTAANQTIASQYWSFGNGQTSTAVTPTQLYATAGTYNVQLVVTSNQGCVSDTNTKPHTVNPLPTPAFVVATPACETEQITFTNQSTANAGAINKWYWNLANGRVVDTTNGNPFKHSYANFGVYNIQLAVSTNKGCLSDTLSKNITINALPKPGFILPEVCLSDAFAIFNDTSTIADGTAASMTYNWNFGDANATPANPNTSTLKNARHKYSAVGAYTITLTVTSASGCASTITKQLVVNGDIPVSKFDILNSSALCSNIKVEIQNKSTVNFGSLTKTEVYWDWANNPAIKDVDDSPVPDKIYSHLYPNFQSPVSKIIRVRFLSYSGGVCVDDTIRNITLNASPKAQFTTTPGICLEAAPLQILQASDAGNLPGIGTFSGPGVSASGVFDPAATGVGTFTLNYLYVTNAGCRDSTTQTKTVWPRPVAKYGVANPICETQNVVFSDTSVANFGKLAIWKWKFGDNTVQNNNSAANFAHIYATAGTYTTELQVVTDSGCTSVPLQKTITVNPLPAVNFGLPIVCLPLGAAQFTDSTKIANGTQAQFTYAWSFGDGATATTQNPLHNYGGTGPYSVRLAVTSNSGCTSAATKILSDINPQPKANFSMAPPSVCIGDIIAFTDQTNPLNQTITNWYWNFDDNRTGTLQNMSHLYTTAGTYNVKLYVKTNKGCFSDTATKPAIIYSFPTVNAGPDLVVLLGGQAKINATATNATGLSYKWTPSKWLDADTLLTPTTTPQDDVTYKLTVTGNGGCVGSDEVFVKLLLAPVVPNAFSPNNDGINDVWAIQYLDSYPGATVKIFDRYGRLVFNTLGYPKPFDGKLNGTNLPIGVYYYIVDPKNGRKPITGSVTILR
jgi:gliding motility-associated-like protein